MFSVTIVKMNMAQFGFQANVAFKQRFELGHRLACHQLIGTRMNETPQHVYHAFLCLSQCQIAFRAERRDIENNGGVFVVMFHIKPSGLFIFGNFGFHGRKQPIVFDAPLLRALFKRFIRICLVFEKF